MRTRSKKFSVWLGFSLLLAMCMAIFGAETVYAQINSITEQCANDSDGSNETCAQLTGSDGWVSGNVGQSKGNYKEGDFLPARQVISTLTIGDHYCFGFGWDVTASTLPAVDYVGTYNATLPNADPRIGTTHSGSALVPSTISIPTDPALSGTIMGNSFSGTQQPGGMLTMWGGTFTPGSLNYSITSSIAHPATSQQSLEYCFTATATEAVMSFGLHIAIGAEWGGLTRPTGSPYHFSNGTRNGQFTGPRTSETDFVCEPAGVGSPTHFNEGRRERQFAAKAIRSGTIKIVKIISGGTPDETFTFDLQDSSLMQIANPSITTVSGMGMSDVIVVSPGTFSIEETLPSNWSLLPDDTSCVGADDEGTLSGTTISGIDIVNENNVVCTFTNEEDTLISLASFSAATTDYGAAISWTTAAEIDNAGFNIYSSDSTDGPWEKVNSELITAEGGPARSTDYRFTDASGASFYMLEDVDTFGVSTRHGPVSVDGTAIGTAIGAANDTFALFLPLLQK